jgi:hypothetical protein
LVSGRKSAGVNLPSGCGGAFLKLNPRLSRCSWCFSSSLSCDFGV